MSESIGIGSNSYGREGEQTCSIQSETVPERGGERTITNPLYHRPPPDREMLRLLLRCNSHLCRLSELLATSTGDAIKTGENFGEIERGVKRDRFRLAGTITRLAIRICRV